MGRRAGSCKILVSLSVDLLQLCRAGLLRKEVAQFVSLRTWYFLEVSACEGEASQHMQRATRVAEVSVQADETLAAF